MKTTEIMTDRGKSVCHSLTIPEALDLIKILTDQIGTSLDARGFVELVGGKYGAGASNHPLTEYGYTDKPMRVYFHVQNRMPHELDNDEANRVFVGSFKRKDLKL